MTDQRPIRPVHDHDHWTAATPAWNNRPSAPHEGHEGSGGHEGHGGHRWMMIACCIPMLLVVGALVASGVAGAGAIAFAVICLTMMAIMMFAMPGDHH